MKGIYHLTVSGMFDAAHYLKNYKGKCANLHGHTWKVEMEVSFDKLNSIGISMDFKDLKSILQDELNRFDHKELNKFFGEENPTAENIAKFIYGIIKNAGKVKLEAIRVWETPNCCVEYKEVKDVKGE